MNSKNYLPIYTIRLQGHLAERWLGGFEGLEIALTPEGETELRGELDQAALHGVLNRIRDLGMEILSIRREA